MRAPRRMSCWRTSSRFRKSSRGIALFGIAGEEDFAAEGLEGSPEAEAPEAEAPDAAPEGRVGEHMRRRRVGESLEAEVVSLFAPRTSCFTAAAASSSCACTCAISACSSFSSANSAFTFCMVKPPGARGQLEARR